MAAATSLVIVVLQDASLSSDLRKSAQERLQWTSTMASHLLDSHLADQFERYESVSATPQFVANLEARHGPTLTHYAKGLAETHGARSVVFLDSKGRVVAGHGGEGIQALVMERMHGVAPGTAVPGGKETTISPLIAVDGAPYSVVKVPLYYQPKLDLLTGEACSAEALLRWNDPERGVVGPGEFIALAEETGAIVAIGDWVLKQAMEQVVRWQAEGVPPIRVAVNLSARQLEAGGNFAGRVAELLEETGLDPSLLDLEITEGAMVRDEEAVIALLERLRGFGVGLALHDFGTGYSSLSYLRRLPINTLKIDRSFIIDVENDPEEAAMVESIISMAQTLNLRVIAEGLETINQQKFLHDLGCDEIQGFIFSKPLPAAEAAIFLGQERRTGSRMKGPRNVA